MVQRGAITCPVCGSVLRTTPVPKAVDGELVEIGIRPKKERQPKPKRDEKQAFYSGLIDFALRRGWKIGWAKHKYREKFGVWPVGLEAVPMTPRKAVKEFIWESARKYREQQKQAKPQGQETEVYQGEF